MTKKNKLIFFVCFSFITSLAADFALAADFGLGQITNNLHLSLVDPKILVLRIIQIALSFLGILAVVLVLYAGFLWMSSAGDEDRISQAKKILKNALIGLLIILSAWAIVTFVISRLLAALGNNNNWENPGSNITPGLGAVGSCTVESFYPVSGQKDVPRNTSIIISFKEELKLDSVCVDSQGASCACNNSSCNKLNPQSIRLYKTDLGDACGSTCPNPNANVTDVLVTVPSDHKTLVLSPISYLGSGTENTWYSIKFTGDVKKIDGTSIFKTCQSDYLEWKFEVNTSLDLTPPKVVAGGVFPSPDNLKDAHLEILPAAAARGSIMVNACPQIYSPARLGRVTGPTVPEITLDYHGQMTQFEVSVLPATPNHPDQAQLFDGSDHTTLLGVADFNSEGAVVFPNFFTFKTSAHNPGNLWAIAIIPEKLPDTLTVGSMLYTFASSSGSNLIKVPTACNLGIQADNIKSALSSCPDVTVDNDGNVRKVSLSARIAGGDGNNIVLATSNGAALTLSQFTGGRDLQENFQINGKKDKPMNSVIQVNFNETINPVTVSGSATEVGNYIQVVNANENAAPTSAPCNTNSDCLSYKCENLACVGNYISGKFTVSNNYRTVEFVSDVKCGVNGCGEEIYCLPSDSHLAVKLMAADLKSCAAPADCLTFSPYKNCVLKDLSYKTCQDQDSHNYPLANLSGLNGIIDAANNSLDGDRSSFADGPISFYDDNFSPDTVPNPNLNKHDNYKWSFYISDKIALTPPQISLIEPVQGASGANLINPVKVTFNTLMMNSSLRTGSALISNGSSTFEHKLINLRSSLPTALGFWILNNNNDVAPLDGEPDITIANIYHSPLVESATYKPQVGSGVKDIYQNCYKPSVGPNCAATPELPSCCFGNATSTLGTDGNCK